MTENQKKRRAEEQLSPYSHEPADTSPCTETVPQSENTGVRKMRARRNKEPQSKESLKGIFGKVSLTTPAAKTLPVAAQEMIAGINRSFLKALNRVVERQSSKDLTYLFRQYEKFIKEIKQNTTEEQ